MATRAMNARIHAHDIRCIPADGPGSDINSVIQPIVQVCPAGLIPRIRSTMLIVQERRLTRDGERADETVSDEHRSMGEGPMNAKAPKTSRQYDGDLQMFRDEEREPDREILSFLRWMVEQGRLEHEVYGPSCGEYAAEAA
jgi:hypothetical protein